MANVKITVLKRTINWDVNQAHMGPTCQEVYDFPCPAFEEGDSFLYRSWSGAVPEGFCPSAWIDIQGKVQLVQSDGRYPEDWVIPAGAAIACCTDGYRPVVFKLERVSDEPEAQETKDTEDTKTG